MIDQNARNKLLQRLQNNELVNAIKSIPQPEFPTEKITQPMEKVRKASSNHLAISALLVALVRKVLGLLSAISQQMPSKQDLSSVKGAIEAINIPSMPEVIAVQSKELLDAVKSIKIPQPPKEITVENLDEIINQFTPLVKAIEGLKKQKIEKVEIINPPQFDTSRLEQALSTFLGKIPLTQPTKKEKTTPIDLTKVTTLLTEIRESLDSMPQQTAEFPTKISVDNFPPQMTPQPVTSININPLRGFIKSTAVTVTTSLTPLPGTSLANRRSISIYNNGSGTLYIGGSDVTAANGVPISSGTWGPEIDAGPRMILYGRVSSGTLDVRVLEMSNDDVGGNQ